MTSAIELKNIVQVPESFQSIPLAAFEIIDSQGIDLFSIQESGDKPALLCSAKLSLTEEKISELRLRGCQSLLVQAQCFMQVSKKLHGSIDSFLHNSDLQVELRYALLQIAYADEITRLFKKSKIDEFVILAQEIGTKISSLFQTGDVSAIEVFENAQHSSSPYSHVTNVAAYAVLLALSLEKTNNEEIDQIAVGCILHEVGKLYLPEGLIKKKGRLSTHDRHELERVPQLAYEALCEYQNITFGQLMMAYQQYERTDGTGYPVRTLPEDIHPWAKLLSVVDVFDTITCERDYCPAQSRPKALLHLADGAKTQFDPEIVLCLITNFQ